MDIDQPAENEWELCKENIQPLKAGRRMESIKQALRNDTVTMNNKMHEFEHEIRTSDADDQIDVWYSYIIWTEQNVTNNRKILKLMQRCVEHLDTEKFKENEKYVEIWIKMGEQMDDPKMMFDYMFDQNIGTNLAVFYKSLAEHYEMVGAYKKADELYNLGINRNAQPVEKLLKCHQNFALRMSKREENPDDVEIEPEQKPRRILGSLKVPKSGRVGNDRVKNKALGSNKVLDTKAKSSRHSNSQGSSFAIFGDENQPAPSFQSGSGQMKTLPTKASHHQENLKAMETLKGAKVKSTGMKTMTSSSNFEIYSEENTAPPVLNPTPKQVVLSARKPLTAKKPSDNPYENYDPAKSSNPPNVVTKYCKNIVYMGAKEISFEELKAELPKYAGEKKKPRNAARSKLSFHNAKQGGVEEVEKVAASKQEDDFQPITDDNEDFALTEIRSLQQKGYVDYDATSNFGCPNFESTAFINVMKKTANNQSLVALNAENIENGTDVAMDTPVKDDSKKLQSNKWLKELDVTHHISPLTNSFASKDTVNDKLYTQFNATNFVTDSGGVEVQIEQHASFDDTIAFAGNQYLKNQIGLVETSNKIQPNPINKIEQMETGSPFKMSTLSSNNINTQEPVVNHPPKADNQVKDDSITTQLGQLGLFDKSPIVQTPSQQEIAQRNSIPSNPQKQVHDDLAGFCNLADDSMFLSNHANQSTNKEDFEATHLGQPRYESTAFMPKQNGGNQFMNQSAFSLFTPSKKLNSFDVAMDSPARHPTNLQDNYKNANEREEQKPVSFPLVIAGNNMNEFENLANDSMFDDNDKFSSGDNVIDNLFSTNAKPVNNIKPVTSSEKLFQNSVLSKTPVSKKHESVFGQGKTEQVPWAPSPTVNTKNAMANVKSMFEITLDQGSIDDSITCPVDSEFEMQFGFTAKPKSQGFSVFQDNTVSSKPINSDNGMQKQGFQIFSDIAKPSNTGFQVYQDIRQNNTPATKTEQMGTAKPGFTVYDENSQKQNKKQEKSAFQIFDDNSVKPAAKKTGFAIFEEEKCAGFQPYRNVEVSNASLIKPVAKIIHSQESLGFQILEDKTQNVKQIGGGASRHYQENQSNLANNENDGMSKREKVQDFCCTTFSHDDFTQPFSSTHASALLTTLPHHNISDVPYDVASNVTDYNPTNLSTIEERSSEDKIHDQSSFDQNAKTLINPFDEKSLSIFLQNVMSYITGCQTYLKLSGPLPKLQGTRMDLNLGPRNLRIVKLLTKNNLMSLYRANDESNKSVSLKISTDNDVSLLWDFYMSKEIQRRLQLINLRLPNMHMNYLHHKYCFQYSNAICIETPFYNEGSLMDLINLYKKHGCMIDEILSMVYTHEILSILHTLHSMKIIHCNIKPDVFLLADSEITDAGPLALRCLTIKHFFQSIDLTQLSEAEEVMFVGSNNADSYECREMNENKAWKYQADYFAAAATIHMLVFQSCMNTYIDPQTNMLRISNIPPSDMNVDFWSILFSTLINSGEHSNVLPPLIQQLEYYLTQPDNVLKLQDALMKKNDHLMTDD